MPSEETEEGAEFDAAWGQDPAAKVEDKPAEAPTVEGEAGEADKVDEASEQVGGEAATAPNDIQEVATATVPDPAANRDALLGRIQAERGRIKASERGLPKMEKAFRDAYGSLPGDKTPEELKALEDEETLVAQVEAELPDVVKATRVIARREAEATTGAIDERAEAIQAGVLKDQRADQWARVTAKHPDAAKYGAEDTPEGKAFHEWVRGHPYEEAVGLMRVIQGGYPEEVITMLDGYKGTLQQGQDNASSRREQELEAARAVPARQSAAPTGKRVIDVNDFDGAFDEAVRLGEQA